MKIIKILNLKNSISKIKNIGNNKIAIIDKKNTFKIYSSNNYNLLDGFKINLKDNNPFLNNVDISSNGKYIAISIDNKILIWNTIEKKLIHKLSWHKGNVLTVSISPNEEYILTGGEDGKSYIWSIELGKIIKTLTPHADYVLSSEFDEKTIWCATGSYNRNLIISNLVNDIVIKKKPHKLPITQISFFKNKLITGDKSGEIIIWNLYKGKVLKRFNGIGNEILDLKYDKNTENIFILNKSKNLFLYIKENDELISNFIKLSEIPTTMEYIQDKKELWIGTTSGIIYVFDILSKQKEMEEYLINKEYSKIYELTNENPFLKNTEIYRKLEDYWSKIIDKSFKLLIKGEKEKVNQLVSHFLSVTEKKYLIQNMFDNFSEFEKFKQAVLNKRYNIAYILANKYPIYKNTQYYDIMEKEWEETYKKAINFMKKELSNNLLNSLFKNFRGVQEKTPLIQSLINQKQIFYLFIKNLKNKDYEKVNAFIKKYPFLVETVEYKKILSSFQKLYENTNQYLKNGNFKKAFINAKLLENFPEFKEKGKELKEKAHALLNLQNNIANKNYDNIELLIKKYSFLVETEDYINLKIETENLFNKAKIEALKGNFEVINTLIKDFLNSKFYKEQILEIYKIYYFNQLIEENNIDKLKLGIINYISYFGKDENIISLIKNKNISINIDLINKNVSLFDINNPPIFIWEK